MNTVTFKELVESALSASDSPAFGELDTSEQTKVKAYVNQGLQELWKVICDKRSDLVFKIAPTISVVSGTEAYDLPADFYHAIKLWWTESDRRFRIEKFELDEIDSYPKPLSSGDIELWYAPSLKKMKLMNAVVPPQIEEGWEQYAVLFAAVRLLDEEQTDSSKISQERDRILSSVQALQGDRDEQPGVIGDYFNRFAYNPLKIAGLSNLRYRIMGQSIYFVEVEMGISNV